MTFVWCFSYLLFFRTTNLFSIRLPVAHSNAIQLMLTLKVGCCGRWQCYFPRSWVSLQSFRPCLSFDATVSTMIMFSRSSSASLSNGMIRTSAWKRSENKAMLRRVRNCIYKRPISRWSHRQCEFFNMLTVTLAYWRVKCTDPSVWDETVERISLHLGPYYRYRTFYDWLEMKHGVHVHGLTFMRKRAIFGSIYILTYLLLATMVSFNVRLVLFHLSCGTWLLSLSSGCLGWSILW